MLISLFFLAAENYAQTQGVIYKPAEGAGRLVLDPNGSGNIFNIPGDASSGSVVGYHALPQIDIEPLMDPRTGPGGGHTDLVANSSDEPSAYIYYDSENEALLFRLRLADQSTASKGYSFLFNTEFEVFGPQTDNFSTTNPAFAFEVVLETGHGITIYDLDKNGVVSSNTLPNIDDYYQKAIADDYNNDGTPANGFFYDFYVPISEIDNVISGSFTTSTEFKAIAATITRAQSGIVGTISDVAGIDDSKYNSINSALVNLLKSSPKTSAADLGDGGGFTGLKSQTPSIITPVIEGDTEISGTTIEESGTITVTITGSASQTASTSTITDGKWTVSGLTALSEGDEVTARISVPGKTDSDESDPVKVLGETIVCTARPIQLVNNGNRFSGIVPNVPLGAQPSDLTIRLYQNLEIVVSTSSSDNPTIGTANYNIFNQDSGTGDVTFELDNANAGNPYNGLDFLVTAQYTGLCESDYTYKSDGGVQTEAPTITSTSLTTLSTSVDVDAPTTSAAVTLYLNNDDNKVGEDTSTGTTSRTVNINEGVVLQEGDIIYARAQDSGEEISQKSNEVVVGEANLEKTLPPVIVGHYTNAQNNADIEGYTDEGGGVIIRVFIEGSEIGTVNSDAYGNWILDGVDLTNFNAGDTITAKATAGNKLQSDNSDPVTIQSGQTSPPTIEGGVTQQTVSAFGGDISISGSGTFRIYVDGELAVETTSTSVSFTTTTMDGGQLGDLIQPGVEVYATAQGAGETESNPSNIVTVLADPVRYISVTSISPDPAPAGGGEEVNVTYRVLDDNFALDTGVAMNFTLVNGQGAISSIPNPAQTDGNGEIAITYTTDAADDGSRVGIEAADDDGYATPYTASFGVEEPAANPEQVVFTTAQQTITAGQNSDVITIQLQDSGGNTAAAGTGGVTFDLSSSGVGQFKNTDDETVLTTLTIAEGATSASFRFYSEQAGTQSLTVTDQNSTSGVGSASQNITVNPDSLNNFLVEADGGGAIGTQTAGSPFSIQITARDGFGNTITDYGGTANISTSNVFVEGQATGITGFTSGVAAGVTVTLTQAGEGYTLTATDSADAGVEGVSDPFSVNPGAAASIVVTGSTDDLVSGDSRTLAATLYDGEGNVVSSGDDSGLAILFDKQTGDGTVSGLGSVNATEGTADITLTGVTAGTITIRAEATNTAGTTLSDDHSFTVVAGSADQLSLLAEPTKVTSGEVFPEGQYPVVQLRDAAGNDVSQQGVNITVSLTSGDGILSGDTSASTDAAGKATFGNLTITGTAGTNYQLSFESTGLTGIQSSQFEVVAGLSTPVITSPADGDLVNATQAGSLTISGTAVGAENVRITVTDSEGSSVTDTVAVTEDSFTGSLDVSGLKDGNLEIVGVGIDTGGNESDPSATVTVVLDTTPPQLTVNDQLTSDSTPTITGTTDQPAGSEITVVINGQTYTNTVDGGGSWSVEVTGALADAAYTAEAATSDEAGNETTATGTITVDSAVPAGYTVAWDTNPVNSASVGAAGFTISGGEDKAAFEYEITSTGGGTSVTGNGTITNTTAQAVSGVDVSGLGDGTLTVSVTLRDEAGNEGGAATADTDKDTVAPRLSDVVRHNPIEKLTNADQLTFRLTFSEGVTGVTGDDFAAAGPTGATINVQPVSGTQYDIVLSGGDIASLDSTVSLALYNSEIEDAFGNALTDTAVTGSNEHYTLDNTPPVINSITLVGNPESDTTSVQFAISLSESVENFGLTGFSLVTTGNATGTIAGFSGAEDAYTITVNQLDGSGTIGLNFTAEGSGITDLAGNAIEGDITGNTHEVEIIGGINLANSDVTAVPAELEAGQNSTVTVTLRDGNNNPITGVAEADFTFTLNGSATLVANSFQELTGAGDEGKYTIGVTNQVAEEVTVTVAVDEGGENATDVGSAAITFTPAAAAKIAVSAIASPQTAGETFDVMFTLQDTYGNTVSDFEGIVDLSVQFGDINTQSITFALADNGQKTANITLNQAGANQKISAAWRNDAGVSGASNEFDVSAGAAAKITVTPASRAVTAGERVSFEVIRFDAYDNEVTSGSLTVNLSGESGTGEFFAGATGGSAVTSLNITDGNSAVTVWYTDTNASEPTPYNLTFNAGAGDLTQTTEITQVSPNAASKISLTGPASVTVGEISDAFTIKVLDAYGNETVTTQATTFGLTSTTAGTATFYSDPDGNNTLTGNDITVGAGQGAAEFYYADTQVNTGTEVTAARTAGDEVGNDTHQINITETAASRLAILDLQDPVTAGQIGSFRVQIQNDAGDATPASGPLRVNLSSDQAEGRFYKAEADFDSNSPAANAINDVVIDQGDTEVTLWYYGTSAGEHALTAEDNESNLSSATASTTVIAADAAHLSLTADPSAPVAGGAAILTATITDSFGNAVQGAGVDFSRQSGNGSFDGVFTGLATDSSGKATATYQTHTTVETADVRAELSNDASINDQVSITSVAGDPAKYLVSVSDESPAAGTNITVSAQLADANDNPIGEQSRTVNWSATNGGAFASASSQTDASGVAEVTFTTSGTAGITHEITAADNLDSNIKGVKSITTASGDAAQFVLNGPAEVEAGAVSGSFSITLQDAEGNTATAGAGGVTFNLSSTDEADANFYKDNGGAETATAVTIGEGKSSGVFYYSNESAGEQTLTVADAEVGGGLGSKTVAITVTPSGLHEFTVAGIDDPTTAGEGNTVTVTALDRFGNVKTDYTGTVTFTSTDAKADLPATYSFVEGDNGSRTFTGGVILRTAGEQWVQAADSDKAGRQENITVQPADVDVTNAGTLLQVLTNNVEANGTAEAEVRATLLDEFDNPVPNVAVTFSANGDAQLAAATGNTDANGRYSVSITNSTAETVEVTATYGSANTAIGNGSPAEVTFISGAASQLAFVQQPTDAAAGNVLTPSVTVQLLDASGNTVDSDGVGVSLAISDGATLNGTVTQATKNGVATFGDLYIIQPGNSYTLTATSGTLNSDKSDPFTITRRALTITAGGQTKTYGDDDPALTYQITSGSLITGVELNGELSREPGEDVDRYAIVQNSLTNANNPSYDISYVGNELEINTRDLTLNNFAAGNKVYDGTSQATGITFDDNRQNGDDLKFKFTAEFDDAMVGNGKTVNITGISISGGNDAANYNLTTASGTATADVTPAPLTVVNAVAQNKVYDGTTAATITGAALSGVVDGDDVSLQNATAGVFAQAGVGTDIPVSTSMSLGGADAGNYSLTQPTGLKANITNSAPDITAWPTASDITYGEALSASGLSGGTSDVAGSFGFVDDSIRPGSVGTYAADVIFMPDDTENYSTVTGQVDVTVAVRELTVTGSFTALDKVYDGTKSATIGENNLMLSGLVGDDEVTLSPVAEFENETVGIGKTVRLVAASSLSGADVQNYTLSLVGAPEAQADITVGAVSSSSSNVTATSPHTADGVDASTVTIEVKDASANAIKDLADSKFTVDAGANASVGPVGETSTPGIYEVEVTNTVKEEVAVKVTVDGVELEDKPTITFNAGPPAVLTYLRQPSDTQAGETLADVVVEVRDAQGNTVTADPDGGTLEEVVLAFADGTNEEGATLLGTASAAVDWTSGTATFRDLYIDKTGNYQLSASTAMEGINSQTSAEFDITAGEPADLVFTEHPSTTASNQTMDNIVIQLRDSLGNNVAHSDVDVTLSISDGATLNGTVTVGTDSTGRAVFSDLSIVEAGIGYTLTASAANLPNAVSDVFDITAGSAALLTINSGNDQTGTVADTLDSPLQVQITDGNGNPVSGETVRFNLTSAPSGSEEAELLETEVTTDAEGLAHSELILGTVAGAYEVTVSSGTLDKVVFKAAAVAGEAAELIVVSGDGQSQPAGEKLTDPLVVKVVDTFDNPVVAVDVRFSAEEVPDEASGHMFENSEVKTDSSGEASAMFTLGNKAGRYVVKAVSGAGHAQFKQNAEAGQVARLVKIAGDNQVQPTLSWLSDSLVVQLRDQFDNPVSNQPVVYSLSEAPGGAAGNEFNPDTAYSDDSGFAFSKVRLGDTAGKYTFSVKVKGQETDSVTFNASALFSRPDPTFIDTVNTVVFNGSKNTFMYAEPNESLDNMEDLTAEVWVLPVSLTDYYELLSKGSEGSESDRQFVIWGEGNTLFARIQTRNGESVQLSADNYFQLEDEENSQSRSKSAALTYKWTHLAFSVDGENGRVQLFKNGFKVDEASFEGTIESGAGRMTMGSGLNGEIHEVRVWNQFQNQASIQARMTQLLTGTEDNLVLYHTFDDATDERDDDLTNRGNHLFLSESVERKFSVRGIPDVEMLEDDTYILAFKGLNEDGGELQAVITELPNHGSVYQISGDGETIGARIQHAPATLTDSDNRAYYIPNRYYYGEDQLRYKLVDQYGNEAAAERHILIHPVNNRPAIHFADAARIENKKLSFDQRDTLYIDLTQFTEDVDNIPDELTWEATILDGYESGSSGKPKGTIVTAQQPAASDGEQLMRRPHSEIIREPGPSHLFEESSGLTYTVQTTSEGTSGPRTKVVQYNAASEATDSLIIEIDNSRYRAMVTTTPLFHASNVPVRFDVQDLDGETDSDTLLINVNKVNDAPNPFRQLIPANDDTVALSEVNTQVVFKWEQSTDLEGDEIQYQFAIWDDSGNREVYEGIIDTTLTLELDASILEYDTKYQWRVLATDRIDTTRSVEDKSLQVVKDLPLFYRLSQNYPNPFRSQTTIRYRVPVDSRVIITLYDILGRKVGVLVDEEVELGFHEVTLDANRFGLASGVYLYRMVARGNEPELKFVKTRKLVVVK